jgi:hypothetical protein
MRNTMNRDYQVSLHLEGDLLINVEAGSHEEALSLASEVFNECVSLEIAPSETRVEEWSISAKVNHHEDPIHVEQYEQGYLHCWNDGVLPEVCHRGFKEGFLSALQTQASGVLSITEVSDER